MSEQSGTATITWLREFARGCLYTEDERRLLEIADELEHLRAETVMEALRAEVAQSERRIAAADRLVDAVQEHQRYWARVDWASDRLERRIIDLLSEYQNGSQGDQP